MVMRDEEPYWGDESGIIKCYMCKTEFDYDMGNTEIKVYPTTQALEKDKYCVEECGIVEVFVFESECGHLFMDRMAFEYEAGGILASVYPSKTYAEKHDFYAVKYGVRRVEVVLSRVVRERMDNSEIIKRAKTRDRKNN